MFKIISNLQDTKLAKEIHASIDPFDHYTRVVKVAHPGDAKLKAEVLAQRKASMQPGDKVPRVFDTIWSGSTLPDKYVKNLTNLICEYFRDGFIVYLWTDQDFSKNSPMGRQVNALINLASDILGVSKQDVQEQVKCHNYYNVLNADTIYINNSERDILLTAEVSDKRKTIPLLGSDILRVLINTECGGGIYLELDLTPNLSENPTGKSFTALIQKFESGMHSANNVKLTDGFFFSPGHESVKTHCEKMAKGLSASPTAVRRVCPSHGFFPVIKEGRCEEGAARFSSILESRVNSNHPSNKGELGLTEIAFEMPYCSDLAYQKEFNRVVSGTHIECNAVKRAVSEIVHELINSPFFPNLADIEQLEGGDVMIRALKIVKKKRPDLFENVVAPITNNRALVLWNKISFYDKEELSGLFSRGITEAIVFFRGQPFQWPNADVKEANITTDLNKLASKDTFNYNLFIDALISLIENMVYTCFRGIENRTDFYRGRDDTFECGVSLIVDVLKHCAKTHRKESVKCIQTMKAYMGSEISDRLGEEFKNFIDYNPN